MVNIFDLFEFNFLTHLVIQFSKKTGDYASLSLTDIKVLALTLQLEWEKVGRDSTSSEPAVVRKSCINHVRF
jgi:rRNA maturation endonuclease Nob1